MRVCILVALMCILVSLLLFNSCFENTNERYINTYEATNIFNHENDAYLLTKEEYKEIHGEVNEYNKYNNGDLLKQIIVSNNIILVSNSFILEIKENLSKFIISNKNDRIISGLSLSNDSVNGWCLEFGDLWTIGEWTVQGSLNLVTASYFWGFGKLDVIYERIDDHYIQTHWEYTNVDY